MKILGKISGGILGAVAMTALLAGPASAQDRPTRYGEEEKAKTPSEIAAQREAERAYQRSLGNIPEQQKSSDPWGIARGDSASPKAAAKTAPAKAKAKPADTKTGSAAK